MSEVEHAEARYRAEWLHKHKAPQDWLILTASEVATLSKELDTAERAHSEAMKLANAFHEDQTQLLLECNKAIQQINELTQQVEQLRSSCAEAIKDLEFRRELYKVQEQFLEKARSARNELQQKYDNLATEHMLVVNKICNERDEARAALMKIEEIFVDGEDTFEDRMAMGNIAREALEGRE